MAILYGLSAWQYHQSPPLLRETEIPPEAAFLPYPEYAGFPRNLEHIRSNASETVRAIQSRLTFDLKGLSLPIRVMVNATHESLCPSPLITPVRTSTLPPREHLIPIGGGLYVPSPALTLAQLAGSLSFEQLLLHLYEACGIYAAPSLTNPARFTQKALVDVSVIHNRMNPPSHLIREFSDANGIPVPLTDSLGNPLPWNPCFDRRGNLTNLWKRPPLTSCEELADFTTTGPRVHGIAALRKALPFVRDGSGSPLESTMVILICLTARRGAEAWPWPFLNRRIDFTDSARTVAHQTYAVGDLVWPEQNVIIEVNGKSFHADKDGFTVESGRRAALEASGYTVLDINYEQMSNLEKLDTMLESFARQTGFPLKRRTISFLRQREKLHRALFGDNSA